MAENFYGMATVNFEDQCDEPSILLKLEYCGRTCYKSEPQTGTSSADFVRKLITRGHESVLEHVNITVRFICDRGVSHELVRHRLAAYSQESTRYCDYGKTHIMCISPEAYMTPGQFEIWKQAMDAADTAYKSLRKLGCSPQIARSVLPNSLKTEIVTTMNLRQWRHVLRLRTSKAAHPQMREIMHVLLAQFKTKLPVIFEDITYES